MGRIEELSGRVGWDLDHGGRALSPGVERSDAARNRRKILETSRALFEERGVTRVTMEDIARAASIGKGTLYRRFANKGLLCQALLDEPTRDFQRETLVVLKRPGGPLEKLGIFLDRLVRFTEANLDLLYGGHETLSGRSGSPTSAVPPTTGAGGPCSDSCGRRSAPASSTKTSTRNTWPTPCSPPWTWTSTTISGAPWDFPRSA